MDPEWLAAANAALAPSAGAERFDITIDEEIQLSPDCSPTIAPLVLNGTPQPETRIRSPYELPGELGAPFRAMIDCGAVNRRLEWIASLGFTMTGIDSQATCRLLMFSTGRSFL
jgi:hypothetical protein